MKVFKRLWPASVLGLALIVTGSCNKDYESPESSLDASRKWLVVDSKDLGMSFEDSFCSSENEFNAYNAYWMAAFAANEYAHFGVLGPWLASLGFGKPGEGERWEDRWYDLDLLREAEALSENSRGKLGKGLLQVIDRLKIRTERSADDTDETIELEVRQKKMEYTRPLTEAEWVFIRERIKQKRLGEEAKLPETLTPDELSSYETHVDAELVQLKERFSLANDGEPKGMAIYFKKALLSLQGDFEEAQNMYWAELEAMESKKFDDRQQFSDTYYVRNAASLLVNLVQLPNSSSKIQFFSGGKFKLPKDRWIRSDKPAAFKEGSTQVLWAEHQSLPLIIISFRGTEPDRIKDILVDLMALKENFEPENLEGFETDRQWGRVHRGFNGAHETVAPEFLWSKLQKTQRIRLVRDGNSYRKPTSEDRAAGNDGKKYRKHVWITGHSLGAALATLQTSYMLKAIDAKAQYGNDSGINKNWLLRGLYTFGSPRVGNAQYRSEFQKASDHYKLKVVRFRNRADVVTRVPKIHFNHVGSLAYFDPNKDFHHSADLNGRMSPFYNNEVGRICAELEKDWGSTSLISCLKEFLGAKVGDHDIAGYADNIRATISKLKNDPNPSREIDYSRYFDCKEDPFEFDERESEGLPFF